MPRWLGCLVQEYQSVAAVEGQLADFQQALQMESQQRQQQAQQLITGGTCLALLLPHWLPPFITSICHMTCFDP